MCFGSRFVVGHRGYFAIVEVKLEGTCLVGVIWYIEMTAEGREYNLTLRIKEAQRVLTEHPEWSVESVADYCGFNDRKYFHQVFQQYTGTTPAKYQQKTKRKSSNSG